MKIDLFGAFGPREADLRPFLASVIMIGATTKVSGVGWLRSFPIEVP